MSYAGVAVSTFAFASGDKLLVVRQELMAPLFGEAT